jgi:zinc protease
MICVTLFPRHLPGDPMRNSLLSTLRNLLSAGLVLSSACAGAHAADLPASKPLKVPELKFEKYKLANGLEVLTYENHRLPLVAVDLWYHVGPVNEKAGRTGFAHLFEHMMFEGSEHVGEKAHFRYLEGAGATDINGTTDFDRTNYFETVPSNQLELALWLESDRMGFLLETLDRTKLTNQRDVVRNELRQDEGQPYDLADEEIYHQLFPKGHPYHGAVIGSHADVEAARLTEVREFFEHYYTPNNASIAVAGDFDPAKLHALLEKYFGTIPKGPTVDKVTVTTPPITSEKRVTITDTVQLPRISLAWLTPQAYKPGNADTDMLVAILGHGKSSRLYRKLVYERQIAQSVECENDSLELASVTQCDVIARPGVKVEDLQAAIDQEIETLRSSGPTEAEVTEARNVILTNKISGLQRLGGFGGIADTMDRYNQYLGTPDYLQQDIARFQNATIASIKKIGQDYFGNSKRVVVITVPGKKVTEDVPRSPADTDANVQVKNPYTPDFEASQDWRKTPPTPGPQPELHLPVPDTFALANGLKVYLVENHALPVFSATLTNLAGSYANPAGKPGLAGFTARMLTEGTSDRSATQLADDTASIGATLASEATMDSAHVNIASLSNSVDGAMTLLSDVTLHPAFESAEVERIRKQRLTAILQEGDQPVAATLRVGMKVLYGDYPYGYRDIGTTDSVKAMTRDDLASFWTAHYGPQTAALVIAGDVTKAEAQKIGEQYFGAWPQSGKPADLQLPPPPPPPARKVVIVDKPGAPQTTLIAFGEGPPRASKDYPAITVMNGVLGGLFSSRINMNLREKNGYTYGGFSGFFFYRDGGPFYAGAQVRTDVTAPAAKELFSELNRIRTDPPTAAELKLAKDNRLLSLPGHFETVANTTNLMSDLFSYNLALDYYQKLPGEYLKLTPDEVEKAAIDFVHPDNLILMAVGDRAKIEGDLEKLNLGPIELRDESGNLVKK